MEPLYGPSTSQLVDEVGKLDCCSICKNTQYNKEVLRLIVEQLSILLIRMYINNGRVTIKSKSIVNFKKISLDKGMLYPLYDQSNHINTWQTIQFSVFMERFSEHLSTDVHFIKQSIENILTSPCKAFLDFDLQKLMEKSDKQYGVIEDTLIYMFWYPRYPKVQMNGKFKDENWFDLIDQYRDVAPHFMMPTPVDQFKDSIDCVHIIEQSVKKTARWYFLDVDGISGQNSYSIFMEMKKKNKKRLKRNARTTLSSNVTIFEDSNEWTLMDNHLVRYFLTNNNNMKDKCPFETQYIVDLLKDPFMQFDGQLPFIIQCYNLLTSKYVFYMIYKGNVKPTKENFYRLLTLLRDVLLKMQIDCVMIQNFVTFDSSTILEMVEHVFGNCNIKMLIPKKILEEL